MTQKMLDGADSPEIPSFLDCFKTSTFVERDDEIKNMLEICLIRANAVVVVVVAG
jgi:hypothetical protein